MGRTAAQREEMKPNDGTPRKFSQLRAAKAEAQAKKKAYQDTAAMPEAKIKESDRPYVEAFSAKNRGARPTITQYYDEIQHWKNLSNGDVRGYQAYLNGEIQVKNMGEKHKDAFLVTQAAVDRMGGKVNLRANTTGQVFIAPENAEWTVQQGRRKQIQTGNGYAMYGVGEAETKGLSGVFSEIGDVYKAIPKEFTTLNDPMGIVGGILGGSKQKGNQRRDLADLTGAKESEVAAAQTVADAGVKIVLSVFATPAAAAAYTAASGASKVMTNEGSIAAAVADTMMAYAMTPTTGGSSAFSRTLGLKSATVGQRFVAGSAASAAYSIADAVAGRPVTLEGALVGAVSGGATSAINTGAWSHVTAAAAGGARRAAAGGNGASIAIAVGSAGTASLVGDTLGGETGEAVQGVLNLIGDYTAGIADQSRPRRPPAGTNPLNVGGGGRTVYRRSTSSIRPTPSPTGGRRGTGATFL
jgi:hypothetical protein